jgi:hypothetical protein
MMKVPSVARAQPSFMNAVIRHFGAVMSGMPPGMQRAEWSKKLPSPPLA